MALKLRADDAALDALANITPSPSVEGLRAMAPAVRSRAISSFLRESGVREPEAKHIALAERLIFSKKPSAQADFPGGVVIRRCYDRLEAAREAVPLSEKVLSCPGTLELPELGIRVTCGEAETLSQAADTFTVCPAGPIVLRSRMAGDGMRTRSGTKSLKKLFIDGKIPASRRALVPVFADEIGILGVYGFGPNLDRTPNVLPAVQIRVESLTADG